MDQDYRVTEAAWSLSLNANLLYKWKGQQEAKASGAALRADKHEELRAENKRLRMKKDILKNLILLRKRDELGFKFARFVTQ